MIKDRIIRASTHRTFCAACAVVFALEAVPVAMGQPEPTASEKPASRPVQSDKATADKATIAAEGEVAVTVNGVPILERKITETISEYIQQQSRGRPLPPEQLAQAREALRPQVLEAMIANELLDQAAETHGVTLTDEEALAAMNGRLEAYLMRTGSTREEFEQQIRGQTGSGLSEFVEKQAADPQFRQAIRQLKLLEKKYPEKARISDEAVKERYDELKDEVFTQPAEVRASHILVRTDQLQASEEKQAARAKAEEILKEVKKPGVDFAELAKQKSEGPSAPQGGDLGFFPRQGAMVEPFAAAAFALKPGEVSDIVETQFGYHIIKVTERKEGSVVSLEQAAERIRTEMKNEELAGLRDQFVQELKKNAKIEYPG